MLLLIELKLESMLLGVDSLETSLSLLLSFTASRRAWSPKESLEHAAENIGGLCFFSSKTFIFFI